MRGSGCDGNLFILRGYLSNTAMPHWHALISIASMQAGKDVLCEKPMSRFIAEGRGVVQAAERYGRIFQIGTYGRFGASRNKGNILTHIGRSREGRA